ncbi:MAG: hypothetical protein SFZ23_14795 [Planctomycetota bacterium]|nr:hypothetical protein [Planctomycetota bacterium]
MNDKLSTPNLASLFIAACSAMACSAAAQVNLYSNAFPGPTPNPDNPGLSTGDRTLSNVAAPTGFVWSEVATLSATESNAVAGFSTHALGPDSAYRFADDFTVPEGPGWRVTSFTFYAYQTDATAAPIASLNLRIWNGRPDLPTSQVIFGDTSTNRLESSISSGIYRVFTTLTSPLGGAPGSSRLIWASRANASVVLAPGTYWVDWQYTSTNPDKEAFSPPITLPGQRSRPNWNALQFRSEPAMDGAGVWTAVMDPGKPASAADVAQDLPFIIAGTCPGDFNLDGQTDFFDFLEFVDAFGNDAPTADINADGQVDFFDYLDFSNAFGLCA